MLSPLPSFLQPVNHLLFFMDNFEVSWELQDLTLTSGVVLPQPRSLLRTLFPSFLSAALWIP